MIRSGQSVPRVRAWPFYLFPVLCAIGVLMSGLGCSGDTTMGTQPISALKSYWALQLNQHAVNLALTADSTAQLTAVPLNAAGTPLTGFGSVTYLASDSSVSVSPTGLVKAHFTSTTGLTSVVASLQLQGVTLTDTAFIQVTQTPLSPALATFSIQPAQGDSAKRSVDFASATSGTGFGLFPSGFPWPVTAIDGAKDTVCNGQGCPVLVNYQSSNPSVASIDRATGMVTTFDTGHVVFTATTLAYGVVLHDSVSFTVGYPLGMFLLIEGERVGNVQTVVFERFPNGFIDNYFVLGVGGVIDFIDATPKPVDVVFDQQAGVDTASFTALNVYGAGIGPPTGSGNIPAFGGTITGIQYNINGNDTLSADTQYFNPAADGAARRFTIPGTYRFHSSLFPSDTIAVIIRKD
jgi:hypothetical protein